MIESGMNRRQFLEHIIIGSLLEPARNYYDDCRCSITAEMFSVALCRRIYTIIEQMRSEGCKDTDPCSIWQHYGDKVADILGDMMEICNDYSFVHLKCQYNLRQDIIEENYGIEVNYTDVEFGMYVNQFIQIVFSDERKSENFERGQGAAA